ncbi:hypothetical protein [Silvibacterium acidisoli]|uniref:hypothetical protein n=1 Tax=Acidobacteriaceae bacterium ZG23-2 TaxID=2883246 RepID=UPI00406C3BA1
MQHPSKTIVSPHAGSYVRLRSAPGSQLGTLQDAGQHEGRERFLFSLDSRLAEYASDIYLFAEDVEVCERPTDEEIELINKFLERRGCGG